MCKFRSQCAHRALLDLTSDSPQDAPIGWTSLKFPCHPQKDNEVTLSFSQISPTIAHPMEVATMTYRRLHHFVETSLLQLRLGHPQQLLKIA